MVVEALIKEGHHNPYLYTPKQAFGFYKLFQKRRDQDRIVQLNLMRLAYHGDDKEFKKIVKELSGG